ncbi:sugar transferase [Sphingomonas ginkgonis]|uniref:Sugar transferase n=2 Tax=Sphingomonas ginkgonis TaxID=2315330 RepID=A0A429VE82_9SPHN|nr:sugar transferase [Sphingomonas ginkgonis]
MLDLVIASACLLLLWPVMLGVAVLVWLTDPGPIVFRHKRLGRNGEVFHCLKFRTMRQDADRLLNELLIASPALMAEWIRERKLRNDPRITPVGGFLRRYSLDELPQLINVLRGEMSIVGPRPLSTDEAHYYGNAYPLFSSINPGITGLWQVSGRNDVSYPRRVQLDCQYVRTRCVRGDLMILLRTVPVIFGGTGY